MNQPNLKVSFDGTPNFSFQPRIVKSKMLFVKVDQTAASSGNRFFLPYDEEINRSLIFGIRWHPSDTDPQAPATGTITTDPNKIVLVDLIFGINYFLILVNEKEEQIQQPYPLYGMAGYRRRGIDLRPKVTPRYHTRLDISKCYLQLNNSSAFPDENTHVALEIIYKPIAIKR